MATATFGSQPVDFVVVAVLLLFGLPTVWPLTETATPWFSVIAVDGVAHAVGPPQS